MSFLNAPVQFKRSHCGHHNYSRGLQSTGTALDIQEFFRPEIRAEACFGHGIISQLQSRPGGDHRIAPVSDIGKRPSVDEHRCPLRVWTKLGFTASFRGGHGALGFQIAGCYGFFIKGVSHNDLGKTCFQVTDVGGQAQYRHDLRGHGDVVAVLPGRSVHPAAQTVHHGTATDGRSCPHNGAR